MPLNLYPGTGHPSIDIKRIRAGELSSFRQLYQLYYEDFYKVANSHLLNKCEAANLVDHSFIKCWYRSNEFSSFNHVIGFLNYTLLNQCMACNNGKGNCSIHHALILKAIHSKKLITRDRERISALRQPGPAREIFKRFYARRLSLMQIAEEMGISREYAREQLDLAFRVLHQVLINA